MRQLHVRITPVRQKQIKNGQQKEALMAFNPINYLKESRTELERVVWPTPSQTVRLTLVVIIISVIVGAYIAGLDTLLTKITETFIK